MQDRERFARRIQFISSYNLVTHVQIKFVSLFVIFVYIYFVDIAFVDGLIHECFAVTVSLFFGQDEQHFQHVVA